MKEKIFVLVNDIHLKWDNTQLVKNTFSQVCDYCLKENIQNIVIAGDIFTSQISQRLNTLKTWRDICFDCGKIDLTLHIIAGNHDKTLKDSDDSFLDIFNHTNIIVYRNISNIIIENVSITLLPYYNPNKYISVLEQSDNSDILVSHQGICGSINNDGSVVENGIKPSMFKKFKKTYLGHYHNTQEVTSDIIHTPSLFQNNHGEDVNKGFTVIHKDLSYKIINTNFPKYITKKINLSTVSKKDLKKLESIDTGEDHIRLVLEGKESEIKSIDKNYYRQLGFDISIKNELLSDCIEFDEEFVEYEKELIIERFKEFCEENELNLEEGNKILNKVF